MNIKRIKMQARILGLLPLNLKIEKMATSEQYEEVRQLRMRTYGKRYPALLFPETPAESDISPATTVLMARCTKSGKVLGTLRLRHSRLGLALAGLKPELFGEAIVGSPLFMTFDRFAIDAPGTRRLTVRLSLFVAGLRLAQKLQIPLLHCVARDELAPIYEQIGFMPLAPAFRFVDAEYFNVEHEAYTVPVDLAMKRCKVPFKRYFHRRFSLPLKVQRHAPAADGGPRFCFTPPPAKSSASTKVNIL